MIESEKSAEVWRPSNSSGVKEAYAPRASAAIGDENVGESGGKAHTISRREFCAGAGCVALLAGLGALSFTSANPLCRPPGGQNEGRLYSLCIRCERCYEVCPENVIAPARLEDGIVGIRMPTMNFSESYCDFCEKSNGGHPKCVEVCPTGALALEASSERPALSCVIGQAVIDINSCLAYRDTGCRYCYDACKEAGMDAISIESDAYGARPLVDESKCNGCGACQAACVSLQGGLLASGTTEVAIVVRPVDALRQDARTSASQGGRIFANVEGGGSHA